MQRFDSRAQTKKQPACGVETFHNLRLLTQVVVDAKLKLTNFMTRLLASQSDNKILESDKNLKSRSIETENLYQKLRKTLISIFQITLAKW